MRHLYRDIAIPAGLQDAMSRRARAEREKEARIIPGSAEWQIAQAFVDAAKIYATRPAATQLRAMNLVYEATEARGMTIIVPSATVDSLNPGGVNAVLGRAAAAS